MQLAHQSQEKEITHYFAQKAHALLVKQNDHISKYLPATTFQPSGGN
jgi:hypothetical protein